MADPPHRSGHRPHHDDRGHRPAADTLGSGFFSVFASGLSPTGTSTVNYTDASIANFFISALSTGGALTVRCGSNAAHCIIDVMGFLY